MKIKKYLFFGCIALVIIFLLFLMKKNNWMETFLANHFSSDTVFLGKVISSADEFSKLGDPQYQSQILKVTILSGPNKEQEVEIHNGGISTLSIINPDQKIQPGELVTLSRNDNFEGGDYYLIDRYRLGVLLFIFLIFVAAIIIFGRLRGLASLLGLLVSIAVLMLFVVPRILNGDNPLLITFLGSVAIAFLSLYLAHGFNNRTTIALLGTLITIVIAVIMTYIFVSMAKFVGIGTEEAFTLKLNATAVNLHGLILGGIIIGMLGVLDDVTIGQVTSIYEIHQANLSLGFTELYRRGISVGREHIASLVNTLVLAYVGASFPLFLLTVVQSNKYPLWLAINGEPIAVEIVRTIVGSLALIFAVPITTLFAAYYYGEINSNI